MTLEVYQIRCTTSKLYLRSEEAKIPLITGGVSSFYKINRGGDWSPLAQRNGDTVDRLVNHVYLRCKLAPNESGALAL